MNLFITGTDTDVGKTYVTRLLLRALSGAGQSACGYKPFCSGGREEAEILRENSLPRPDLDLINPCWWEAPVAPVLAAELEERPADLTAVYANYERLCREYDHVLVEGAGGWLAPLAPGLMIEDLAREMQLPVVVVAANRLGVINHTLLTVARIENAGLTCAGVILNDVLSQQDASMAHNRRLLTEFCSVPVIAEIARDQSTLETTRLPFS
jgi:dethiobiotin synthetase